MGITYTDGIVRGPTRKEEAVRFLIDSGATYSLLPKAVWEILELVPKREMDFSLADGTIRRVSECYIVLPQGEGYTPVVLGEPGDDDALLGVGGFRLPKRTLETPHMAYVLVG